MPVNDTKIKVRNNDSGPVELELQPNPMSRGRGRHKNAREIIITLREVLNDLTKPDEEDHLLAIAVDVDELTNAIDLIKLSHYDMPEDEYKDEYEERTVCDGCGRP